MNCYTVNLRNLCKLIKKLILTGDLRDWSKLVLSYVNIRGVLFAFRMTHRIKLHSSNHARVLFVKSWFKTVFETHDFKLQIGA